MVIPRYLYVFVFNGYPNEYEYGVEPEYIFKKGIPIESMYTSILSDAGLLPKSKMRVPLTFVVPYRTQKRIDKPVDLPISMGELIVTN
jgi:hypothetical protein